MLALRFVVLTERGKGMVTTISSTTNLLLFATISEQNLDYARQHLVIVERFGRFPHRNAVLGRRSTDEEIAFLNEPNSSF